MKNIMDWNLLSSGQKEWVWALLQKITMYAYYCDPAFARKRIYIKRKYFLSRGRDEKSIALSTVRIDSFLPSEVQSVGVFCGSPFSYQWEYDFLLGQWLIHGKIRDDDFWFFSRQEWEQVINGKYEFELKSLLSHSPSVIERALEIAGITSTGITSVEYTGSPMPYNCSLEDVLVDPAGIYFTRPVDEPEGFISPCTVTNNSEILARNEVFRKGGSEVFMGGSPNYVTSNV
jgi:hypothetical protein